jgi:hypothetical protein
VWPEPVTVMPTEAPATLIRRSDDARTDALVVMVRVENHARRPVTLETLDWSARLDGLQLGPMQFDPARNVAAGGAAEMSVYAHLDLAGELVSPSAGSIVSLMGTLHWRFEDGPLRAVPFSMVVPLECP